MGRRVEAEDEWDDDEPTSDDSDDDYGYNGDEESETIPCPQCRRQIHEDAQRCPYCEHYLTEEDAVATSKPWWVVAGALVSLYIVYRWSVGW